jgi:hypothetical protein
MISRDSLDYGRSLEIEWSMDHKIYFFSIVLIGNTTYFGSYIPNIFFTIFVELISYFILFSQKICVLSESNSNLNYGHIKSK